MNRNTEPYDQMPPARLFDDIQRRASEESWRASANPWSGAYGELMIWFSSMWRDRQRLLKAHRALIAEHNRLIDFLSDHDAEVLYIGDDGRYEKRDLSAWPVPVDELLSQQLQERCDAGDQVPPAPAEAACDVDGK